jgi:hypothetical protein
MRTPSLSAREGEGGIVPVEKSTPNREEFIFFLLETHRERYSARDSPYRTRAAKPNDAPPTSAYT